MAVVSMSYLLEAGVHFGHQTKRWNPKMKEYIFTSRDDIYIIDLEKTASCIETAYAEIKKIAENGGSFLFVGTKKQAVEASKEEAERSESFYSVAVNFAMICSELRVSARGNREHERNTDAVRRHCRSETDKSPWLRLRAFISSGLSTGGIGRCAGFC